MSVSRLLRMGKGLTGRRTRPYVSHMIPIYAAWISLPARGPAGWGRRRAGTAPAEPAPGKGQIKAEGAGTCARAFRPQQLLTILRSGGTPGPPWNK